MSQTELKDYIDRIDTVSDTISDFKVASFGAKLLVDGIKLDSSEAMDVLSDTSCYNIFDYTDKIYKGTII